MKLTKRNRHGFSLVEMMTVLLIVSVLVALAVPGVNGLIRSTDLTATGESVYGVLHTGRQAARAKNLPVEIRFYRESPETTVTSVEAFAQQDGGRYERIGEHILKEGRGIITLDPGMTTLVTGSIFEDDRQNRPEPKMFQFFRFRPDGSTELDESKKWFLTLLYEEASDENYFTIQVNPFSGNLKTYRP